MSKKRRTFIPFRQYFPYESLPEDVILSACDLISRGCNGLIPTIMKDTYSLRIAKDSYVIPVGTQAERFARFTIVNYDSCALIVVEGDRARWLHSAYDDLASLHFSRRRKSFYVQTYDDYSGNFRSTMYDLSAKNWLQEKEDYYNW